MANIRISAGLTVEAITPEGVQTLPVTGLVLSLSGGTPVIDTATVEVDGDQVELDGLSVVGWRLS